jgi:hypothetical protein
MRSAEIDAVNLCLLFVLHRARPSQISAKDSVPKYQSPAELDQKETDTVTYFATYQTARFHNSPSTVKFLVNNFRLLAPTACANRIPMPIVVQHAYEADEPCRNVAVICKILRIFRLSSD